MAETGAVIEPMSIDEAYLDLSARCQAEDADASLLRCVPIARQLKERIPWERGLTATIGIGSNKLLAKIASDFERPDGPTVVSERDKAQFLCPLPARVLYGAGRVTEQVLLGASTRTIGGVPNRRASAPWMLWPVSCLGPVIRRRSGPVGLDRTVRH